MRNTFLLIIMIILCQNQICLSQINLNIDARNRPSAPIKLSEISTENHHVAVDIMDSIGFNIAVTENFLFFSRNSMLHQYDLSGKSIREFDAKLLKFTKYYVDIMSNKLMLYDDWTGQASIWDFNGNLVKNFLLPKDAGRSANVIGFEHNFIWILHYIYDNEKVTCRISRLNIVNERLEKIMEHDFVRADMLPKVFYSSTGDRSYLSIPNNTIYQVNGTRASPAIKYNILNYSEYQGLYNVSDSRIFSGRYIHIQYGYNVAIGGIRNFLYDTIEKQSWHTYELEDDIFGTGTTKNFRITSDGYLFFRKNGNDVPRGINAERGNTVFFISKLKH